MTKLTIVTDSHGKLIGAVQGHELSEKRGGVEVSVSFAVILYTVPEPARPIPPVL